MNTDIVLKKISPYVKLLSRYGVFLFIVGFLGIYLYLVQHIGGLIQEDAFSANTDSQIKPISRLKIDQNAVDQMNQLEAQNIEVKALFDNARQNPFSQ